MDRRRAANRWAIILAGGDGTRLQDLTRQITGAPIPKQYCRILGGPSLLEATLARTQGFAPLDRTLALVNRQHLGIGGEQLRVLPPQNVLTQPYNRDTGPGVLLALQSLARRDPHACVAVFPSDHYVGDDHAFIEHVIQAADLVTRRPEKIAVLGIRPDRPEPAYGYIMPRRPMRSPLARGTTFHVATFHEKPTAEAAQILLGQGGLWNSFVMVFRIRRMLELLRSAMPTDVEAMGAVCHEPRALQRFFRQMTPWNFSAQFLATIPQHLVVRCVDDVHWSDWGTRDAIERTLQVTGQTPPWRQPLPAGAADVGRPKGRGRGRVA
jgi:mannose-1-phosphate guanylyltransferase